MKSVQTYWLMHAPFETQLAIHSATPKWKWKWIGFLSSFMGQGFIEINFWVGCDMLPQAFFALHCYKFLLSVLYIMTLWGLRDSSIWVLHSLLQPLCVTSKFNKHIMRTSVPKVNVSSFSLWFDRNSENVLFIHMFRFSHSHTSYLNAFVGLPSSKSHLWLNWQTNF